MNQISQMLDDLCLGSFHFETGNILRNSLLLSTLISYISQVESEDEALLRNIPIRFIIMARRLNFLWYVLNEEEDSLLRSCLMAQQDHNSEGEPSGVRD